MKAMALKVPVHHCIVVVIMRVSSLAPRRAINEVERKVSQRLGTLERTKARILEQLSRLQREEAVLRNRLWQTKEDDS